MHDSRGKWRRPKTSTSGPWRWAVLIILSCLLAGGCSRPSSRIIVLPDSVQVFLIDPNAPFTAPWPAVVLSRGRYLELVRAEIRLRMEGIAP